MRYFIYDMLENDELTWQEKTYNLILLITIAFSLIPLMFKEVTPFFQMIDYVATSVFVLDYFLRWLTADFLLKKGRFSFLFYPFTFLALVDLTSILPTFFLLQPSLKLLKVIRMGRLMRIFRFIRHSKNIQIVTRVIRQQKAALGLVASLAAGYIFIVALLIFNIEPDTFDSFFDALYWSTISLTTVGYGDIFAVSTLGKIITMISSLLGLAVVALPSSIITAGYMKEVKGEKNEEIGR